MQRSVRDVRTLVLFGGQGFLFAPPARGAADCGDKRGVDLCDEKPFRWLPWPPLLA